MISPTARSFNQPPVTPVLFPECAPVSVVTHRVPLPDQAVHLPLFPELTCGFPSFPEGVAATTASLLHRYGPPPKVEVVERTPNRIVEILEVGYEEYTRTHSLAPHVREAAQMILRCRTSALGGHVEACPDGHIARIHYNSCGHRCCPRCGYRKRQKWIAQQREKLLPVRHFHATFTIPHDFNELCWHNFEEMARIVFHSAAQALQELLADPERVGVQIGMVASLHTWDDQLRQHPHLHCLVTGGGLTPEGTWKDSWKPGQSPFLVHVFPLMRLFRKLFCRALKRAVKTGTLTLPQGVRKRQMVQMIRRVNRTRWQVHIAKPVEDGGPTTAEILEYQAKAVAGGPMSEIRIEGIERKVSAWQEGIQAGQEPQLRYVSEAPLPGSRVQDVSQQAVTFRWGTSDQASGRRVRDKSATLPIEEFLRRLFFHVPPPDLHTIRQYGLYSTPKQAQYEQCRAILPASPPPDAERTGTSDNARTGEDNGRVPLDEYMEQCQHCPVCGKKLVITRVLPSSVTGKIAPRDKALARKLSRTQQRRRGS